MADPIHQFQIQNIVTLGHVGGQEIALTNSALYMIGAVVVITALLVGGMSRGALVPGRLQSLVEMTYEFVANTVRTSAGTEGMKFLPFVFSIFMFVLILNLFGMIPYAFTVTSHIIITFALAALVIGLVIVYGFIKHGLGFLKLFVPSGVPGWLLPLLVTIEVISFVSRPLSLSVRLFANMLAGHIALKIFAGFVATLLAAGAWSVLSPLPLALAVALTALEVLVAVLQAYVFATLTTIYLNDALHPGHH
ncbi:F0F1 ATP synthase subunit A [Chelatococcus reniformis]|uniref:ATP synthase subunit a n=1 Tax=Chelatococcus reniformis TaxID=1494448 RepID=A0A916U7W5_9HYPH|nr:F0F1 ATP synthase subunit A [Chelatococcus reniformis]GGC62732.1 ATP synthase subunit a [Chelatococcus reniformis]